MRIVADTNVLVRAVVRDDEKQARIAASLLLKASTIAIPTATLCEFMWVLRKLYGFDRADVIAVLRALLDAGNVAADGPASEAGLAMLEAGGDFADGVIAFEGQRLGGETFVSFDKKAVALLSKLGSKVRLL